jgi:hypothetical protein
LETATFSTFATALKTVNHSRGSGKKSIIGNAIVIWLGQLKIARNLVCIAGLTR